VDGCGEDFWQQRAVLSAEAKRYTVRTGKNGKKKETSPMK